MPEFMSNFRRYASLEDLYTEQSMFVKDRVQMVQGMQKVTVNDCFIPNIRTDLEYKGDI